MTFATRSSTDVARPAPEADATPHGLDFVVPAEAVGAAAGTVARDALEVAERRIAPGISVIEARRSLSDEEGDEDDDEWDDDEDEDDDWDDDDEEEDDDWDDDDDDDEDDDDWDDDEDEDEDDWDDDDEEDDDFDDDEDDDDWEDEEDE